jgi:hypothetical protein
MVGAGDDYRGTPSVPEAVPGGADARVDVSRLVNNVRNDSEEYTPSSRNAGYWRRPWFCLLARISFLG